MRSNVSPVPELEASLLREAGFDEGWALIERFAGLVRESGSDDERQAADYVAERLHTLGIEHEVHEPELYLSLPRESAVEAHGVRCMAKPPSFSAITGPGGTSAPVTYVPARRVSGTGDLFTPQQDQVPEVSGTIVVTEGYAMPATVQGFEAAGAVGQIYVNPGDNVHWGICTPIWGTPTTANLGAKPRTPTVSVNRPDGEALIEAIAAGGLERVTIHAALDEGWYPCKLPVARIAGARDEFMLVHGHYDSWDVGVGDNAVGDATMLELARSFHSARDRLGRSLWIAWWPAHSTGRYGGSTWFADRFALPLRKRCVAAVNVDSPGCWHATRYDEVMWMAEAAAHCAAAIRDTTGIEPAGRRPLRAGDYSFNQLGLTSFYMLLSNIPAEERDRLGFYPTGGCGGNIAWHTEDDTLGVAERSNLERDLGVYIASIVRVLNADVLPFDYRATVAELLKALAGHEAAAEALGVSLEPVREELRALDRRLDDLYERSAAGGRLPLESLDRVLMEVARRLVPLGYAEGGRFEHDPALPRPPIPRLAVWLEAGPGQNADTARFTATGLIRAINHVANQVHEANRAVEAALRSDGGGEEID